MWDDEVDVVSVGAGPAGLACAVAAVDADLEVFVARPAAGAPMPVGARGWLPAVTDGLTDHYFGELTAELPPLPSPGEGSEVPARAVQAVDVDTSRRAHVETFIGSRLGHWASQCLVSPYGVLFTSVAPWPTGTVRSAEGESLGVAELGTVAEPRPFADWLDAQLHDRDIRVSDDSLLHGLVFENGQVIGVVVDTPDGPWAVRAHVGVAVTPAACPSSSQILPVGSQVSLVGPKASRFGRLEVLRVQDPPAS